MPLPFALFLMPATSWAAGHLSGPAMPVACVPCRFPLSEARALAELFFDEDEPEEKHVFVNAFGDASAYLVVIALRDGIESQDVLDALTTPGMDSGALFLSSELGQFGGESPAVEDMVCPVEGEADHIQNVINFVAANMDDSHISSQALCLLLEAIEQMLAPQPKDVACPRGDGIVWRHA